MSNTKFIKIIIETRILELSAIVTSDVLDLHTKVGSSPRGKSFEDFLHFSFVRDKVYPCVTRVIINNNKAILRCFIRDRGIMVRTEEIHVKQLEWTSSGHDSLCWMLGLGHLSSFTSTAQVILEEFDILNANDMFLLRKHVQIPHACMTKSSMP